MAELYCEAGPVRQDWQTKEDSTESNKKLCIIHRRHPDGLVSSRMAMARGNATGIGHSPELRSMVTLRPVVIIGALTKSRSRVSSGITNAVVC